MSAVLNLARPQQWRITPFHVRSLWLQQALTSETDREVRRAHGSSTANVCIVGGGYVGMWTAWYLKQADPGLDITIVEADICGGGASGRNTGQILPLWSKIKTLESMAGSAEAGHLARASEEAVDAIEAFALGRGIDIGFRRSGWLWLASSTSQLSTWDDLFDTCADHGAQPFVRVGAEEANHRSGSDIYQGGVFMPGAAMVQPALLARELRRALSELGVRIYEESPVLAVETVPDGAIVRTPEGQVRASKVVFALGGWSRSVEELDRTIITVGSEIIATEPISEALDASGWTGGEPVTNARLTLRYTRRTDDGRVIFGRAGSSLGYGSRVSSSKFEQNPDSARALSAELPTFVPAAEGARITHSWIGPVDRSHDGLPTFGELKAGGGRLLYAAGFSGNGVGPAVMAAQSLTSLLLDRDDRWSRIAFVARRTRRWPPEPIRFLGGEAVRIALTRKEDREEAEMPVPWAYKAASMLAPGGLAKDDTKRRARAK